MADAITSMRKAFSDYSSGDYIVPERMSMEIDGNNATVLIMPAYRNKGQYFITKVVTVFQNKIKLDKKTSILGNIWKQIDYDERQSLMIAQKFNISILLSKLLKIRNISEEEIRKKMNELNEKAKSEFK